MANGYARSGPLENPTETLVAQKGSYAADLSFITAHVGAKASVSLLLRRLRRDMLYKRLCDVTTGFIIISGVACTLSIALKCDLRFPWLLTFDCVNIVPRWYAYTAFDVMSELSLLGMAVYLVWDLHLAWSRKAVVVGVFALRIPIIPITITRVVLLVPIIIGYDLTYNTEKPAFCTEILLQYSLMTAMAPCLRPSVKAVGTVWSQGTQSRRSSYAAVVNTNRVSQRTSTTMSTRATSRTGSRTLTSSAFMGVNEDIMEDEAEDTEMPIDREIEYG
ncbi:hypothetical protein FQN50_000128 [Emmonsiellopsis sp. PD_5]|nr:hypothetical protein FQN50_000128 [Emmonsiellopsis sp. PD_5]